jgi:exopolyphosphatase/guanosine-5'-triphosphate,3'-diphosphate pyrophosphatase
LRIPDCGSGLPVSQSEVRRKESSMRAAAVDVGTNTVRLLIADADGAGGYRPVLAAQEITRLGQGLLPTGELQPTAMQRSVVVLREFCRLAALHGTTEMAAVGTSALREAQNRQAFLEEVRRKTGLDIQVVSGEEEARLTLLGVRAALPDPPDRLLLMDIGGGSTEFLLTQGAAIRETESIGLGVVKLTEAHLHSDPPQPGEVAALREAACRCLACLEIPARLGQTPGTRLVGTAGTVTTLAAIDMGLDPYDPARVNGYRLTRERVAAMVQDLAARPLEVRRRLPGLEPGRADVIVAGSLICQIVMEIWEFTELIVSDGGLREGILLDLMARLAPRSRLEDRKT